MTSNYKFTFNPDPRIRSHNIKVFQFINGMTVVGWVYEVSEGTITVFYPFELFIDDDENESIIQYEFVPYLENLVEFDIDHAYPFVFPTTALQSVSVPSEHVSYNYQSYLLLMKKISNDLKGIPEEETKH